MRVAFSHAALDDLSEAPTAVRVAFEKQLTLLLSNVQHPSLRVKKYNSSLKIWQARVNRNWRFYFTIQDDLYLIEKIIPHPK